MTGGMLSGPNGVLFGSYRAVGVKIGLRFHPTDFEKELFGTMITVLTMRLGDYTNIPHRVACTRGILERGKPHESCYPFNEELIC